MRYSEFSEQATIGSTPMPMGSGTAAPAGATQPNMTGNVTALQDPKMQAAQLAQRQQDKAKQKQAIQAQIAALQKQLADLNRAP